MSKYCSNCGNEIKEETAFCAKCGTKLTGAKKALDPVVGAATKNVPEIQPKSKLAAGLLQIFLGGFGIGRFYLGYTGIGIAQLLVTIFTCGIGAIWPFIDGILILSGSVPTDANGNPLGE